MEKMVSSQDFGTDLTFFTRSALHTDEMEILYAHAKAELSGVKQISFGDDHFKGDQVECNVRFAWAVHESQYHVDFKLMVIPDPHINVNDITRVEKSNPTGSDWQTYIVANAFILRNYEVRIVYFRDGTQIHRKMQILLKAAEKFTGFAAFLQKDL